MNNLVNFLHIMTYLLFLTTYFCQRKIMRKCNYKDVRAYPSVQPHPISNYNNRKNY